MALPKDDSLLLLHNPRCSKSRELKGALDARGVPFAVRLYLEEPLNKAELADLARRLGSPLADAVRRKESAYARAGLGDRATPAAVAAALVAYPVLLERPILVRGSKAAIGRPTGAALALLDGDLGAG